MCSTEINYTICVQGEENKFKWYSLALILVWVWGWINIDQACHLKVWYIDSCGRSIKVNAELKFGWSYQSYLGIFLLIFIYHLGGNKGKMHQ